MKTATACTRCRNSKRKCWQAKSGESCMQCRRNQMPCSLGSPPASPMGTTSALTRDQDRMSSASPLPISSVIAEALVENYIQCIHDRPHSIFHIPTLRAAVRRERLHPGTYCALLSYGARFSLDSSVAALATSFFEQAKQHLHLDLENVCLENIQTCILLASLSAASLRPSSEVLYLGIAINMAEILRFNLPQLEEPIITQELKRRIWWTLYMADIWSSAGNGLSRKMNFDKTVGLPIDEAIFHQSSESLFTNGQRLELGIWAYMITLVELFGPIQDLNWKIARRTLSEEMIDDTVVSLANSLDTWEVSLPEHVRYNTTNLRNFHARGLGGPFVALHQGFNHYATLLYYQYLDISRTTTARTREFARRCKHFAKNQSALLKEAKDFGNCEMLYPGVGHSAAISSSVLLHTLLFGNEEELAETRKSLHSNFEILKDLRRYWPSLELTVRRLTVFQNTCLQYAASQTYKFDYWMVRFLLEYHLPLDGKVSHEAGDLLPDHPDAQNFLNKRGDFGTSVLRDFFSFFGGAGATSS